jgi:rhamnogalacturonan endolyase
MRGLIRGLLLLVCLTGSIGSSSAALLFSDTFEGGTSDWIGEGVVPTIVDGQLDLNVPNGGTIWLNQKLSGNIRIEYDVLMLGTRDLNVFWMATDPSHPGDFFAADRSNGSFANYNPLDLYYLGFGGNSNATTRGRKYFNNTKPILVEYNAQPNLLNGANSTYRIRLVQNEGVVEYWIDQNDGNGIQKLWSYDDNNDSDGNGSAYTEGYFGIRGFSTHYRIDNVTVESIPEPGTLALVGLGLLCTCCSRSRGL